MSTVDEILKEVESGVFIPESYVSILARDVKRLREKIPTRMHAPPPGLSNPALIRFMENDSLFQYDGNGKAIGVWLSREKILGELNISEMAPWEKILHREDVSIREDELEALHTKIETLQKDLSTALWASENTFKGTNQWGQVS